ncbi:FAD-dependent oxidoreductase [Klebsiella pneumoniae]|nr:FAD-dependent oxidoreductase [Klebsiella pneumoniae]
MYDFVIIGGGIIGMSTAMQLIEIYPDARIALLESSAASISSWRRSTTRSSTI